MTAIGDFFVWLLVLPYRLFFALLALGEAVIVFFLSLWFGDANFGG